MKNIKNLHNNKAWNILIKKGYNPHKFMYMGSKNPIHHLFKNINTREYISVWVREEVI